MASIVGLPGSLRRGSFNATLLRAAAQLAPDGSRIDVHSLHGVPLYDADVESAEGIPPAVAVLKRSEEHTSELQSLMRHSYAVFCLKKKTNTIDIQLDSEASHS